MYNEAKYYLVLASAASDLDLTTTLLFQLLLSLTSWADDLSNVIDWGVVRVRNVNLLVLLGWLIVRGRLVCWVHLEDFWDESVALLDVFVLVPLLFRIHAKARLRIVNGLWARRSDVWVCTLPVLHGNTFLKIIDTVSPYKFRSD